MEITLWVIGLSLLGVALGGSLDRWMYQAEQERTLVRRAAASQLAPRETEAAPRRPSAVTASELPVPAIGDELPPSSEPSFETAGSSAKAESAGNAADSPGKDVAPDPGLLGRIEIPRLGLRAIVRDGDDESTLRRAVGHVRGTAYPDEGGNTALAAHRDTFFRPLERIELDDEIRLVVPPHTYEYRVDSVRVVEPDEVSVLESNGIEELTLITCHPFRFIGPAPDRFIVKATRVR